MAIDREASLRRAEKLLRQGRLDAAIEEYERLIEDQPLDWNTRNLLGDLHVRAGHVEQAVEHVTAIADHFAQEGFFSRAIALYKKVVKIKPDDEHALLQSAEIAARQGLLVDAKACLAAIAEQRRRRGDRSGANEILVRIAALDPGDFAARLSAARAAAETGEAPAAAARFRDIAADLAARGRSRDAIDALAEAVRLDPSDAGSRDHLVRAYLAEGEIDAALARASSSAHFAAIGDELLSRGREDAARAAFADALARAPSDAGLRARLARMMIAAGELDQAAGLLSKEDVGEDSSLGLLAAEVHLRSGRLSAGREHLEALARRGNGSHENLVLLGCSLADIDPAAGFECIDVAACTAVADRDWAAAVAALQEFVRRVPGYLPALMKLVDVCVDADLDEPLFAAQSQLADCYLASGRATEARVIAEDLVMRTRGEPATVERLRRVLDMLGEPDPDAVVADRLSSASLVMGEGLDLDIGTPAEAAKGGSHAEVVGAELARPASGASDRPAGSHVELAEADLPQPASGAAHRIEAGSHGEQAGSSRDVGVPPLDAQSGRVAEPGMVELDLTSALTDLERGPQTGSRAGAPIQGQTPMQEKRPPAKGENLDEVFQEFRDEVTREDVTSAAAQQYKLALTYLDMAMPEEAIKPLETAVRTPSYRFQAASMLGRIHRQQGRIVEAIEWFERAAETPASSVQSARALLYQLADTLEAAGETARALAVYLELQADAGEYRDVSARIERLSQPETGD